MTPELGGILILALVLGGVLATTWIDHTIVVRPRPKHDCDGCDECGAPMVIDEPTTVLTEQALREAWEGVYADYGTNVVHRHCLNARRDGREACERCARVMVGAS